MTLARIVMSIVMVLLGSGVASLAHASDKCTYTVRSGDTLSGIAADHDINERALLAANPKLAKNPDMLRVGQQLDVCAARPKRGAAGKTKKAPRCGRGGRLVDHEVRAGETLSEITTSYGVDDAAITKYNASVRARPDELRAGQTIKICVESGKAKNHKLCNHETPLFRHEIVPGEHLGQIAGRYGVRQRDLQRWNPALRKNPNLLSVGRELNVCPQIAPRERSKITYTVRPGDTLGEIAARYKLTARELERYQQGRLADANALRDGQTLVVWADGGVVRGFGARNTDKGVLRGGLQLPPGRGYHVKWKAAAWGTSGTIRAIQSAVSAYQRKSSGGPKVHIGDISKRGGGHFSPHVSHQHGRDVDVGYVLKGSSAHETRFRTATAGNLDVRRTWALIKSFVDTNKVTYIFMDYRIQKLVYEYAKERGVSENTLDELFQYPRGRGRSHGIIRHWRGHVNHFHVRFR